MSEVKKVQIRNGFSDRNKIQSLSTEIQLYDFNERTRHSLVNLVRTWIQNSSSISEHDFFINVISDAFCECITDDIIYRIDYRHEGIFNDYIIQPICCSSYDEVLSLIEYIVNLFVSTNEKQRENDYSYDYGGPWQKIDYIQQLNSLLKKEFVGYRFLDDVIVPISDDNETDTIKESLSIKYEGAKKHINNALTFLSDREKPDYKNSIKESISSVESICRIIIGDDKATLGKALNKLQENGITLHPAMYKAFIELYGYTSDQGGIRHAEGMFTSDVSFEEAKYMLVSCCAFVNFLIAEEAKYEGQRS